MAGRPAICVDDVLRNLGYAGQHLDAHLQNQLDRALQACRALTPRWVHRTFAVDKARSDKGHVRLRGCGVVLTGSDAPRHVGDAEYVALLAATAGAQADREIRRRAALSPTEGMLYAAAAAALAEAAAQAAQDEVQQQAAAQGLVPNARFSPGYGDLPLDVQPAILAALDATRRIGLTVTDEHILTPSKSITAFVGLFDKNAPLPPSQAGCATCQLRDWCPLRLKGRTCHA